MKAEEKAGKEVRLHLLKGSQQEHDKIVKDFLYIYSHDDPRVKRLVDERNKITDEINTLLNELKEYESRTRATHTD